MLFFLSIKISLIAILYISILPNEIPFCKWFEFGYRKFGKTWLYKPLFDCEKCFSGQLALWLYFSQFSGKYSPFEHFYFIAQTVIIAQILCLIYNKITEKLK